MHTRCPSNQGFSEQLNAMPLFCHGFNHSLGITVQVYFTIFWDKLLPPLIQESFLLFILGINVTSVCSPHNLHPQTHLTIN